VTGHEPLPLPDRAQVPPAPATAEAVAFGTCGARRKSNCVPDSTAIACGFLIAAIHHAGLVTLPHTPNPMGFLNGLCGRPTAEKPLMILPSGYPAADATVPAAAKRKKPLAQVMTVFGG
jgi:hypothetical protein